MRSMVAMVAMAACRGDEPAQTQPGTDLDPDAIWRDALVTTVASWDEAGQTAGLGEWVREQAYDADGLLVRDTNDADDDQQDVEELWERGDDGQVLRWTVDFDLDGAPELIEDWTYDADGAPLLREQDRDGDGRVDERSEYLAVDGLLAEELYDFDADGEPETRYTYHHDALGRQSQVYGDDFLDGRTDYTARWSWLDTTDLLVEHTRDEGNEGLVDFEERREYDDDRREVWRVTSDRGGTGLTNEWTYRYDGTNPQVDEATWLLQQDGEVLQAVEVTYRWDERGRSLGADWAYAMTEGGPIDFVLTFDLTWTYPE
jgi:hypothetical protein